MTIRTISGQTLTSSKGSKELGRNRSLKGIEDAFEIESAREEEPEESACNDGEKYEEQSMFSAVRCHDCQSLGNKAWVFVGH